MFITAIDRSDDILMNAVREDGSELMRAGFHRKRKQRCAARTGVISGIVATAALWLAGDSRRWLTATVLAAVTFGIDLFSHPSHFGGALTEAVVTGAAAGALSIVVGKLRSRRSRT